MRVAARGHRVDVRIDRLLPHVALAGRHVPGGNHDDLSARRTYRADPRKRVLSGLSTGGNFPFHALYLEAPGPWTFAHYWSSEGAFWQQADLVAREEQEMYDRIGRSPFRVTLVLARGGVGSSTNFGGRACALRPVRKPRLRRDALVRLLLSGLRARANGRALLPPRARAVTEIGPDPGPVPHRYFFIPGIIFVKSPITFCIDSNALPPAPTTPCIALITFCA